MSIETCERHGRYDTDRHHGCPRCESEELIDHLKRNCPDRADEIDELFSPAPAALPDGWKMVPMEPSIEMLSAANITSKQYKAMLAAAPAEGGGENGHDTDNCADRRREHGG